MNEFYNEKFFELLKEINQDYQLVYTPRILEYDEINKTMSLQKNYDLEELYKFPIEREVMKDIILSRINKLTSSSSIELELTEEQKVLDRKRKMIRIFMCNNLMPDILFDDFYEEYRECYKNEKEEYIMSKSEVKKELQNIGFGVSVEYDINDEPKKYIVFRFYNR